VHVPADLLRATHVRAIDRAALAPVVCAASASLAQVNEQMERRRTQCVLVVSPRRRLLGLVTHRDLAQALVGLPAPPAEVPISRVMSTRLLKVTADAPLAEAAQIMARHAIRRVPVVDRDDTLLGLIDIGSGTGGAGPSGVRRGATGR
jgi:CBS domain-containing protein